MSDNYTRTPAEQEAAIVRFGFDRPPVTADYRPLSETDQAALGVAMAEHYGDKLPTTKALLADLQELGYPVLKVSSSVMPKPSTSPEGGDEL